MSLEYWKSVHSTGLSEKTQYDGWLDKYHGIWESAENIIDLGCGGGVNSIFLHERSIKTIACDFSEEALTLIKSALPETRIMCFDMSAGLPFDDNFSDLIIADLSLHYFIREDTARILRDIHRVLSDNGHLLCRVNGIEEFIKNENDAENIEIERHVYKTQKGIKSFFDRPDIEACFSGWGIEEAFETIISKYGGTKYAWEICAKRTS